MLKKTRFYHCLVLGKEIYRGSIRYLTASVCTCFVVFAAKPLISPILIREIFDRLEDGRLSDFLLLSCIACILLLALFAVSYFLIVCRCLGDYAEKQRHGQFTEQAVFHTREQNR